MKTPILFMTTVAALAVVGCSEPTRTASTDTPVPVTSDAAATTRTTTPSSTDTVGAKVDRAGDRIADASRGVADSVRSGTREAAASMREAGRDISARMTEWRLSNADIESDVTANRPIVRTRTAGSSTASTVKIDDDAIEAAIKGHLAADPMLANLKLDVDASDRGEVELEGKARSVSEIAQAMGVALSQDGVTKVTSKIKVDPNAGPARR